MRLAGTQLVVVVVGRPTAALLIEHAVEIVVVTAAKDREESIPSSPARVRRTSSDYSSPRQVERGDDVGVQHPGHDVMLPALAAGFHLYISGFVAAATSRKLSATTCLLRRTSTAGTSRSTCWWLYLTTHNYLTSVGSHVAFFKMWTYGENA